jgi:hypothetical protein
MQAALCVHLHAGDYPIVDLLRMSSAANQRENNPGFDSRHHF